MNESRSFRLLLLSCVVLLVAAALPRSAGATASFSEFTRNDLAVGYAYGAAVADLNHDGSGDLALASNTSDVTVLLGDGSGRFGSPNTFPTGSFGCMSVVAVDVNGDSNPDLLVGHQGSTVSVLLGAGNGTFAAPLTFTMSGIGKFLRTADLNNDGRPDAVMNGGNSIFVRLGNGDGTFGPEVGSPVTGCSVQEMMTADFNEDGRTDVAVLNPCPFGKVSILLGNGDGTFRPQADFPTGNPFYGDAGDVNGDGHVDLAISNANANVSVLLGNGDGTFQPRTDIEVGWDPIGVKIGDLNADGFPDIAVASHSTHAVYLLAGRGDGTFEPRLGVATGRSPFFVQEGDLKTDGLPDIVVPVIDPQPNGGVTLLLNATSPPAGSAPAITAPAVVNAVEGVPFTFTVTANDPDGDHIQSLQVDVGLAGQTFTVNAQNTSGTYSWTPSFGTGRPDPYYVVFTARNLLVGQWITRILVSRPVTPNPPVLVQPADMTVNEGSVQDQTLTATDADGDALTFTKTSGPAFMTVTTVTPGTGTATGNIHVAPGSSDAGTYSATVRATDYGLYDEKSFTITVNDVPGAPVLAPIANMTVFSGQTADQAISATDPDADAITFSFTGPSFMTVTPNAQVGTTRTGNIHLAPSFFQTGGYPATVTATSNAQSDYRSFTITVFQPGDRAPVVTAPLSVAGNVNTLISFTVSAVDPDGDALVSLTAAPLPLGATFTSNAAHTAGTLAWTPSFSQAGGYSVTFTAANSLSGMATTAITVTGVDRPPVANAGPDQTGVVNVPVDFDGSGSADPDGDALAYAWDFGDGATATGVNASHSFAAIATYTVTLTVTANGLSGSDTAIATIIAEFSATAFTTGGNGTVSLNSGKPYNCVQIQPAGGSMNFDVDPASIRMQYSGGAVSQIFAGGSKTAVESDKNHDGVGEITACFTKSDLRQLFSGLPAGTNTVTVDLRGDLVSGGGIHATLSLVVKSSGGALAAVIAPNPLNPRATVTFATSRAGAIRVQIFDAQGRWVKTIADRPAQAGFHELQIDGSTASGSKLASGVYLVRISTQFDGQETKRFTVLK